MKNESKVPSRRTCARHNSPRKDARICGFFLCEECFREIKISALNNKDPEYVMDPLEGFCLNCNEKRSVKQYFWYLCPICERVIRSYGKERAAREFVLNWWHSVRNESKLDMRLEVCDVVVPMPYSNHRKTKKKKEPLPDFISIKNDKIIFNIEMKTGGGDINAMTKFQLDVSDCDDILSFMKREEFRVPTFVFHVQVVEDYAPPTVRNVALNAWWASVYDLERHFIRINRRRIERRPAAYFSTRAFKPLDTFISYICSNAFEEERRLVEERLPVLYRKD